MNAMMSGDIERDLNEAMQKDLPGAKLRHENISRPQMPPAATLERTPSQQLEQFMASSKNMLEIQRRNIISFESAYQQERLKLLDDYRVRIEILRHECADMVRELDAKHRRNLADSQNLLDRLAAMRALD
jgi:hypothetical protein